MSDFVVLTKRDVTIEEVKQVFRDAAAKPFYQGILDVTEEERNGLAAAMDAKPGDCIFFGAGTREQTQELLGAARLEIARRCDLIDPDAWAFTWVVDAPLFKPSGEAVAEGGYEASNAMFRSPQSGELLVQRTLELLESW